MADAKKYAPINGYGGGTLFSDLKIHFSLFSTKRTVSCAYGFIFVFIAFSTFLAFAPSNSSVVPWFSNVLSSSTAATGGNSSDSGGGATRSPSLFSSVSVDSYRSHFSSILSYFFPNPTMPPQSHDFSSAATGSAGGSLRNASSLPSISNPAGNNQTDNGERNASKVETLNPVKYNTTILPAKPPVNAASPPEPSKGSSSELKNQTKSGNDQNQTHIGGGFVAKVDDALKVNQSVKSGVSGLKNVSEKGVFKNLTSSLMKKQSNGTGISKSADDLIKSLMNCDMFDGNWVRDESYPLYSPGSCSLIDEQFNCFLNGRPDNGYHKLKWKPKSCTLPRLNGSHMLEMLRGKRLVFVGDSLNRNMWESLICILRNSVKDEKKVYEESGKHHFRTEASYSFIFEDYKCRVEFFVSPFLVQEWETKGKNGIRETLRLDLIGRSADKYKNADIIVFNTGHWWTHEKTSKGKDYYQEGSHVYGELDVNEAFRKALTTWGRWVDANVDPAKSLVFFRGYSASHFSGGQWNSGGQCDHETEPIKNETYLAPYPPKMAALEKIFKGMKSRVTYLNVTRMTDYRKDGHPSIYRKRHLSDAEKKSSAQSFQDCSHWCLPGVPDTWNEILYAQLLVRTRS